MKILLSAYDCDPYAGSESATGWNWAYELALAGHDVCVLTSTWGRAGTESYLKANPVPGLHVVYVELPKVNALFGPFRNHWQAVQWQWHALRVARQLDERHDFDLVHHVSWGSIHIGSPLWKLGKPLVFGPVGGGQVAPRGFRRYLRGRWLAEVARTWFVRHLTPFALGAKSTVSNAKLIFVANAETQELARRMTASRVEFMPAAGTLRSWLTRQPRTRDGHDDGLRILWVGRLLPRKGIRLALEALSRIDPETRFTCTILGDGPQGRYLPLWLEQLGLSQRVIWPGRVPWAKTIEAYASHDVLLFTSLRDTDGNQLLEAMAHGLAIVALDHHGAHTLVPADAGTKVPVTKPVETTEALAHALERLAREPATLAAMRLSSIRTAAEHAWDRKVARAIELYPSLMSRASESRARNELMPAAS
jgi:glycosyltransferase involved in cell wall biosynthesis